VGLARTTTAKVAIVSMAAVVVSGTVLSISSASAHGRREATKVVVHTWRIRWPAKHRSRYWVLQMPEPAAGARSGHIYVNGFQVDAPTFARSADNIVACAHRDPAFASGTLHRAVGTIYALVVLTSGGCVPPGPSVAGTVTKVKVSLTLH
jgi:hypothetical protein